VARLQSKVSAGEAGKKGAANQAAGDQPLARPTAMGDMTSQFLPAAEDGSVGGNILEGHKPIDPTQVHGPVRPWARAERKGK
jgi:hypothetical protein